MLQDPTVNLPLLTDIHATLNPGGHTARVDTISNEAMTLRYITIEEDPLDIEEIILLVDGCVERLGQDDFLVVEDRELKNSRSNGYRLRRVKLSLPGDRVQA